MSEENTANTLVKMNMQIKWLMAVCSVKAAYLDISVGDIVTVSVLETLKDRL